MTPPTPEITALLRDCLRLRHHAAGPDPLPALAARVAAGDEALAEAVLGERIGPLLHHTLRDRDALPAPFLDLLRQTFHRSAVFNLLLMRELGDVLRALAARRIAVLVLKGAALAEAVYGGLGLRPMSDVDLLVAQADMAPARQVLEALGYAIARVETHPGVLAEQENEIAFLKSGRVEAWMDLHWSLFDSPYYQSRMAMDWFWETAERVTLAGEPALVLGSEALLIHLCGHLALHHEGAGLLWWQDIVELLHARRDAIDWPTVLQKTRDFHLLAPVRSVLIDAAEVWGAPVPADVLAALRQESDARQAERLYEQLSVIRSSGQRFLTDVATIAGWRQRLRYARTNLFPSAAYMRRRYEIRHRLLVPLYYPYRWWRGLRGLR